MRNFQGFSRAHCVYKIVISCRFRALPLSATTLNTGTIKIPDGGNGERLFSLLNTSISGLRGGGDSRTFSHDRPSHWEQLYRLLSILSLSLSLFLFPHFSDTFVRRCVRSLCCIFGYFGHRLKVSFATIRNQY